MKKVIILAAAALAVLVSCKKEEVKFVESANNEISFKAIASPVTKVNELNGTTFDGVTATVDNLPYVIYASATQYDANGRVENPAFFKNAPFMETTSGEWHHVAAENSVIPAADPIYWPVGGAKMDFLAFAVPAKHSTFGGGNAIPEPSYGPEVAMGFGLSAWETFKPGGDHENQIDLLYASANGQTSKVNGVSPFVKMQFKHAQALLIFNVKVNDEIDGLLTVNGIRFVEDPTAATEKGTLINAGDFNVDNSYNQLKAYWKLDEASVNHYKMDEMTAPAMKSECNLAEVLDDVQKYGVAIPANAKYAQLGASRLIPEQPRQDFTVEYVIGSNTMDYTFNVKRGNWEMGKKYIYNLDFKVNEIVITETVEDWVLDETEITVE